MTTKISANQVEVNDSHYRGVHGKAPRGFGSWAFLPVGCGFSVNADDIIWQHGKMFTSARLDAQAIAAARGWRRLNVGS